MKVTVCLLNIEEIKRGKNCSNQVTWRWRRLSVCCSSLFLPRRFILLHFFLVYSSFWEIIPLIYLCQFAAPPFSCLGVSFLSHFPSVFSSFWEILPLIYLRQFGAFPASASHPSPFYPRLFQPLIDYPFNLPLSVCCSSHFQPRRLIPLPFSSCFFSFWEIIPLIYLGQFAALPFSSRGDSSLCHFPLVFSAFERLSL
jgi:hypothetical protein